MMMDRQAIETIIPHREPFLLIDEVESVDDVRIVAYKHVTGEEDFFRGHFPQFPIMPGVLILESMAQAGAIIVLQQPEYSGRLAFFGGMDKVRFKRKVVPGDTLRLEVALKHMRGSIGFASGKAWVGDELAVSADMIFAIGD
jgi:3-hydroxyacyl-[acyl-carrier-protein] dehydratase